MTVLNRVLTSDNYGVGRQGQKIEAIVLHIMEGTMDGTESWFNNNESNVSSHYGVGKNGEVRQWVEDKDTAWHAGTVVSPTAKMVLNRPGINPNYYTIGIEHEGTADNLGTAEQLDASAELVASLCKKYNIPINRDHIILHREIRANKTCPGKLNTNYILTKATSLAASISAANSYLSPVLIKQQLEAIERSIAIIRKELGL